VTWASAEVTVVTGGPVGGVGAPDGPSAGADVLAVGVAAGADGGPAVPDEAARLASAGYGVDLDAVLVAERFGGRAGDSVRVPVQAPAGLPARFLLIGVGARTPVELRRAGAGAARAARGRSRLVTSLADGAGAAGARALVEGLLLGAYTVPASGLEDRADKAPVRHVSLLGRVPATAVHAGLTHARATTTARDLANTPSNVKDPAWLADRAVARARECGLEVEVWEQERLAADGFGGILAVGAGSASPPRFVRLDYTPSGRAARARPVVLVGKGITYDTGGLSIKPREAMVSMKTDMAGAAAVLAVLAGCPAVGVRRPVVGLLPLAENAVGGASYRPGDVVRHYGGRTVEVVNTDAEGRMVLADALAYADRVLDPDTLVDIATLTGAASLGLGRRHGALFTAEDRLAAALEAAAAASGERVWRMPLVEDYRFALDSDIADLRHVAPSGSVGAGSITAALFLREFAGRRRWAHLDVAGPARADKDEHEVSKGATGYGARLLLRWLEGMG
jgi:leucyl aminopeptidase